jgi:guanidinoacetate N-methyltransferase
VRKKVSATKDSDFLSQIPDWEQEYKETDQPMITYSPDDWVRAEPTFAAGQLTILGEAVMEEWEAPYMRELARIACARGGIVLEIGFGMGISSAFIQDHGIERHIIIEANKGVASRARDFARRAARPTVVLEGLWQDVIEQVEDESIDGILFDSYPLTDAELYQNHYSFFPSAFRKLRRGGGY